MRCLHCNKKLSLLKMAKGDSFCSPEHFDAYQLQLSRSAYDRLISAPEEDAPKAPLILKKSPEEAEQSGDLEADAALARLSVFRSPEKKEAVPAPQVPPYAPFLASAPPYSPPNPAVPASEPDGHEPVEAARNLAFPVHDVEATVCILNLYLRLGLAATPPRDWAREHEIVASPESFMGEITRPTLAAHRSEEIDELAEVRSDEPVLEPELSAEEFAGIPPPAETVSSIDPEPPVEPESFENAAPAAMDELAGIPPPAETVSSIEPEPPVEPESFENAAPAEMDELAGIPPPAETVSSIEPEPPVELEPFENAAPAEMDELAELPPAVEAISSSTPMIEAVSTKPGGKRLPFLVAPSFGERDWDAVPFDAAASSAPREWILAPALDRVQEPGEVWSSTIAPSNRFARIPPLKSKDAAGQPIQSGFSMTAVVPPLLPDEEAIESVGWQTSSGRLGIERPPLEMSRVSTRAVDFALPAPAAARPIAAPPAGPRGMIPEAGSLMRSILETGPQGREPAPVMLPENATACGFMAILAQFPAWEGSSPALRHQTPHFAGRPALPDSAGPVEFAAEPLHYLPDCGRHIDQDAAGDQVPLVSMLPYRSTPWRRTDFVMPAGADPAPTGWQPAVYLLTPATISDRPELAGNVIWRSVFERRFTSAAASVFGHLESTVLAPAALPIAADMPVRDWKIGLCAPRVTWNPCLPAAPNRPLAFLPARGSAILPSAKSWPRLSALAQ